MKREILFRAKRVDNGEWVEGLPCYLTEYAKDFHEVDGIQCDKTREYYDIHPETVCQFTGLLDKNGNKIFEGDKVITERMRFSESQELTVLLHNFRFKFYNGDIGYIDLFEFCLFDKGEITNHTNLEITGNIHDK